MEITHGKFFLKPKTVACEFYPYWPFDILERQEYPWSCPRQQATTMNSSEC